MGQPNPWTTVGLRVLINDQLAAGRRRCWRSKLNWASDVDGSVCNVHAMWSWFVFLTLVGATGGNVVVFDTRNYFRGTT